MEFKDKLRRLRKEKGITQEKLASDLGIPESTIRRYEVMPGTPKRERLELIADYFNESVDYLIGRNNTEGLRETEEKKYNTSEETIKLLEEAAAQYGLSPSDPLFKKALTDALNLLAFTRQQNDK